MAVPILVGGMNWLIWESAGIGIGNSASEGTWEAEEQQQQQAGFVTVVRLASSAVWLGGAVAPRVVLTGLVALALSQAAGRSGERLVGLSGATLALLLAGGVRAVLGRFAAHPTAHEWARDRGYVVLGEDGSGSGSGSAAASARSRGGRCYPDASVSDSSFDPRRFAGGLDATCAMLPETTIGTLAAIAVAVDRACCVLALLLGAAALSRLLCLDEYARRVGASIRRCGRRRPDKEDGGPSGDKKPAPTFVRVHRIARRFDVDELVDEYSFEGAARELADHPTVAAETAGHMFQLLRRNRSGGRSSEAAVWFGDGLCVANEFVALPGREDRAATTTTTTTTVMGLVRTFLGVGGSSSSSMSALQRVGSVYLPWPLPFLRLDGVAEPPSATASRTVDPDHRDDDADAHPSPLAQSMDALFLLLAMYDCHCDDEADGFVQISKCADFPGPFPVSSRGLAALVQDSDPAGDQSQPRQRRRRRRRSYHLNRLGLSPAQWDCLFQSCDGPSVQLRFCGGSFDNFPDAVHGLVSALRKDRCLAGIFVTSLQQLPRPVLLEFFETLERNRSVTELAVGVEIRGVGENGGTADDSALLGLLGCLARRRHGADVLELHVPEFTPHAWNQLWTAVVPSCTLNVRRLVLRTGVDGGHEARVGHPSSVAAAVDEELMVRTLCASRATTLCELDYRNNNTTSAAAVGARVHLHLHFNRFRRLLYTIDNDPSAALQKRWFGTILVQSAASTAATSASGRRCPTHAARCYHLLRRSAGSLSEDLAAQGGGGGVGGGDACGS
jgi:hypothetical protein